MSDLIAGSVAADAPLPPPAPPLRCCVSCGASYRTDFARCPTDGAALEEMATDPLLGTTLEPYHLDALLGEGSMGRVYRAHHARLAHKQYAVKILRGDLAATQTMRVRFAKEAELASKLSHPNVVSVIDFGRSDKGLLYLVMELVEGTSLADVLEHGPIAPDRVARLARGICAGLAYAHDHGLIHRDLKPDNVMIVDGPDGEVPRIADFGIAIAAGSDDPRLTATGFTLGTPAYVSPEQMTAGAPFDHRVDLYALGVTLYEMLAGKLPFDGAAMEQMVAKTSRDPATFAERAPGVAVPAGLERLVRKLMSRRQGGRFATAGHVIAELDRLGEAAVLAPTDEVPVALRRGRGRLAAALGLAVIAAGGVAWWLSMRGPDATSGGRTAAAATPVPAVATANPAAATGAAPEPRSVVAPDALPAVVVAGSATVVAADPPDSGDAPVTEVGPAADDRAPAPARDKRRRHGHDLSRDDGTRPAVTSPAVTPPAVTPPVTPPAVTRPVVTPPPVTPAPATPVAIAATIARVEIQAGTLAPGVIKRAVSKKLGALAGCSTVTGTVQVRFVVGEARKPSGTSASGAPAATLACVEGVIAAIRTDAVSDVGDATVVVHLAFVPRQP